MFAECNSKDNKRVGSINVLGNNKIFMRSVIYIIICPDNYMLSLINWVLGEGGTVNDKVAVREVSPGNRELYAQDEIKSGDLLLSIPVKICITTGGAFAGEDVFKEVTFNSSLSKMTAALMYHLRVKQGGSKYAPYLASLPSPAQFDYHPLVRLFKEPIEKGQELAEKWAKINKSATEKIVMHHQTVISIFRELHPVFSAIGIEIDLGFVLYCYLIGHTRQWGGLSVEGAEGGPTLVPLMDLAQHSNSSKTFLNVDMGGQGETRGQFCHISATCDVPKGDVITINYGIYDDTTLFSVYGFIDEKHEHIFSVSAQINTDKTRLGEIHKMELERFTKTKNRFYISDTHLCTNLVECLRIASLSEKDLKLVNFVSEPYWESLISLDNECRSLSFMMRILKEYESGLHADQEFLKAMCMVNGVETVEYQMARLEQLRIQTVKDTAEAIRRQWKSYLEDPFPKNVLKRI